MRIRITFVIAAILCLSLATPGHAIPQLINYQGILTDGGGTPITVVTNVEFRIWDMSAGGTELWMEPQSVTPSASGHFSVLLGSINPIPDSAFVGDAYLGLTITPDPEMTPRTQLVSIGYSFRTGTVDGASGGSISSPVSIGPLHGTLGANSFVAGYRNDATGGLATISGGSTNEASDVAATVSGGAFNDATGIASAVGGGEQNRASSTHATAGGGFLNTASGDFAFVGGGENNTSSGPHGTVGGGGSNTASNNFTTVGGGWSHTASGDFSTISGGFDNNALGSGSAVSSGRWNTASVAYASIGGGIGNTAGGDRSRIGGGEANTASGDFTTIAGGEDNGASGLYATVPGGRRNLAEGRNSFAAGELATAIHDYSFVWAGDEPFNDFDTLYSTGIGSFTALSPGGFKFFTSSSVSSGAELVSGSGSWASLSDRNVKANLRPVDGGDLLEKISQLEISRWNYETQDPSIEHVGPMAQDFYRLFSVGHNDKTITTVDPDGIALAAIKELSRLNTELQSTVVQQQQQIDELRALVEGLTAGR